MNKLILDSIISSDELQAYIELVGPSIPIDESSDKFNEMEEALVQQLMPYVQCGGSGFGDYYSVGNWYYKMAFNFILNTRRFLCDEALLAVSGWVVSRDFACQVYFCGGDEAISDRLEIFFFSDRVRIAWSGGTRSDCIAELTKLGVL